ncbi:hypothetical protein JKP88DRAFT_198114 [Tribonema minus]|uniref:HTH La-type RNA-binding domain-containing protein n=1 Tax=Tribonema minus TaxID=303371 RepID=A0A836CHL1_9STRA|nr:hypothetical protein JKP88DRAFT_198114 [Tribonema minus]
MSSGSAAIGAAPDQQPLGAPPKEGEGGNAAPKREGGSSGDGGVRGARLEGKELVDALRQQVEFYFSKANLQSDGFLVSRMDASGCVPISVIAQFAKVRALTTDEGAIAAAVANSSVCTVTPQGIRPNLKAERHTIILREIPSDTPPAKASCCCTCVRELFAGEGMAPIRGVRSDVGATWFVTCASEADAMATILALRSRTFEGKPVKARLKGENLLRSFFPVRALAVCFAHCSAKALHAR